MTVSKLLDQAPETLAKTIVRFALMELRLTDAKELEGAISDAHALARSLRIVSGDYAWSESERADREPVAAGI